MTISQLGQSRRSRTISIGGKERGASLVLTLVIMLVGSVLLATLTMYAQTSNAAVKDYRNLRAERYAGEGAIEAAVNWVRDEPDLSTDPDISNPDDCVYQMSTDAAGVVTVSCGAEPGSGSGIDPSEGLRPPEALLALGRRHNQPFPFNSVDCTGWGAPFVNAWDWLIDDGNIRPAAKDGKWKEESIKIKRRQGIGTALWELIPSPGCDTDYARGGASDNLVFEVQGKVVAAGKIQSDYQEIRVIDADNNILNPEDWIKAGDQYGSGYGAPGPRPATADAAGTREDTDPARKIKSGVDNTPATNPIGDIRSQWFPVGYKDSGANAHVLTDRNGAPLPERTHAFVLDPTTGQLSPALQGSERACIGNRSQPIVFLPGWYRDSAVVNDYLANTSQGCRDRTFWFAPDTVRDVGGVPTVVLDDALNNTARTVTGSYYFDFRNTAGVGRGCGDLPGEGEAGADNFANPTSSRFRMCIGGSAAQSPRVVAGWPKDWSPIGTGGTDPGAGTGAGTIDVTLANPTVDKAQWSLAGQIGFEELGNWKNLQDAAVAGGGAASWKPTCLSLIGCLWFFGERSLTFKSFGPQTYAAPIEQAGAENGRVFVNFRYALENGERLPATKLEIRAKALGVPDKQCAIVDLPKTGHEFDATFLGGSMGDAFTYRTDDATAKQIADNCGSVDELNGLFVHFKVGGSTVNWSSVKPAVYLDGVTADYKAFGGASFPAPTESGGSSSSMVAARSDCDPDRPGAQFIFGGSSHVYVADGSLEICAGPYPELPGEHQQIGVYQMPAVEPLRPIAVEAAGGDSVGDFPKTYPGGQARMDNAKQIGEPAPNLETMEAKFGGTCVFWISGCPGFLEATEWRAWIDTRLVMPSYQAPAGYRIKQIDARAAYNPKALANLWAWLPGTAGGPKLINRSNNVIALGGLYSGVIGAANDKALTLYRSDGSKNFLTPDDLMSSDSARRSLIWRQERYCQTTAGAIAGGFVKLFGEKPCATTVELDGVELDITLEPAPENSNKPMLLPASGCITAYPNYAWGTGLPDCAVLRSSANVEGQLPSNIWQSSNQANWNGRFSVKGTVYTPSAAVEIDDIDFAYGAINRGLITRHLRVSGWVRRAGYQGPAISDGGAEPKAVPRESLFVACQQSEARRALLTACDESAGDRILTQASVNFAVHEEQNVANVPQIEWWSAER